MQERYSEEVKSILEAAQQQGVMNYQQELSCAHILVALSSSEGFFRFLLANVKADERNFAQEAKALMQRIPSVKGQDRQLVMSTALARVLGLAAQAAGQGEVNVGNLVAALAGDGDSETVSLLKKYGIDKKKVEGLYMAYTNGQADEESKQTLEKYGQDLTAKAMEGKLDPVIGRDEEIRRVIEILSRRKKNNPVLIGEPGVGKTAIAEGLARRIVAGDVPENLKNKTLYALDLAALVAGAKYRGEFEERLKKVLKVISDSAGQIIMFIDELHTVVGAGAAEGAMDAGNILKPMLARGELRCIGATTLNEYRKYIEKDSVKPASTSRGSTRCSVKMSVFSFITGFLFPGPDSPSARGNVDVSPSLSEKRPAWSAGRSSSRPSGTRSPRTAIWRPFSHSAARYTDWRRTAAGTSGRAACR